MIFILSVVLFGIVQANVMVGDVPSLIQAIEAGLDLNYVVRYKNCAMNGKNSSVDATGGSMITGIAVDMDGVVKFDATKLIYNYQSKTGGYVYDHVRTTIYKNSTSFTTATDVPAPDPNKGEAFYEETFTCVLGKALSFYASEAEESKRLITYKDLLHYTQELGSRVNLVMKSKNGDVNRFTIDTFESFNDPEAFGPPELSWSTTSLQSTSSEVKWVTRSQTLRARSDNTIEVEVVDLDPTSLQPISKEVDKQVYTLGKDAYFVSTLGVQEVSREMVRFHNYIIGRFDNHKQIDEEKKAGKQIHPMAKHVSDIADQKIINLPTHFGQDGRFFVLEETYLTIPQTKRRLRVGASKGSKLSNCPPIPEDKQVTPFLFLFAPDKWGAVTITSYDFPANLCWDQIRNDNPNLKLDYNSLQKSKSFNQATYIYNKDKQVFTLDHATTPLGNGKEFVLTETISAMQLSVMEDVLVNGKSIMPFSTPILYDRV